MEIYCARLLRKHDASTAADLVHKLISGRRGPALIAGQCPSGYATVDRSFSRIRAPFALCYIDDFS